MQGGVGFPFPHGQPNIELKSRFYLKVEMIIMFKLNTTTEKWTTNIIVHCPDYSYSYTSYCVMSKYMGEKKGDVVKAVSGTLYVPVSHLCIRVVFLPSRKLCINCQSSISEWYDKLV